MKVIVNGLKWIGLVVLVLITNAIPMWLVNKQAVSTPFYLKWTYVLLFFVSLVVFLLFLWKAYKKRDTDKKYSLKIGWKDIGIALLFYLAGRLVAIIGTLANIVIYQKSTTANDQAIFDFASKMKDGFLPYSILFLVGIAFFAPIIEELVFRGLGTTFFFKADQKLLAGLVTSALFGFLHAQTFIDFLMYSALGGVMYAAYRRRDNLLDSMMVHILNNAPIALVLGLTYLG